MAQRAEIVPISSLGIVSSFLVKGDRPILIDTGLPRPGQGILRAITQHGVVPSDLALIVITHGHPDHTGGVAELQRATGVPVAVHRLEAQALRTGRPEPLRPLTTAGKILSAASPFLSRIHVQPAEAVFLVDDGFALDGFGVGGRIVWTPGHTAGSISVLLEGGDVFVGDLLMGAILRPRYPGMPRWADDPASLRGSIEKVLSWGPARIHASHGGPFEPEDVRRFLDDWLTRNPG